MPNTRAGSRNNQAGFSYPDVLIGLMILMVGLMALASAITAAVIRTREGEQQMSSKNLTTSTLENIFSARDIGPLGWDAVGNVGSNMVDGTNRGIFLTGKQSVKPGVGADGVTGTADDTGTAFPNIQREIVITDYDDPERLKADGFPIFIRRIDVTIYYAVGSGAQRKETATTMITNYAIR